MRKRGGRVGKADGGQISEYGKRDEANPIEEVAKSGATGSMGGLATRLAGRTGADIGRFSSGIERGQAEPGREDRAKGGRVHLTGGADSGIGRLEKNHKK